MKTPSTRRFAGLKDVLRKGNTGVIKVPPTTGKNRKRRRTSVGPSDSASPVYVSVYEGKSTLRGQIGVASIDPSTTEFHLFNFPVSEGFTSLKSLLLSLRPSDVIIHSLASQELRDAVLSVCKRADVITAKKTCFDDGKDVYDRLTDSTIKQDLRNMEACLYAFAGLVKFAEHQSNSTFAPSSCTINVIDSASFITCPLCETDYNEQYPCKLGTIKQFQEHFFHNHWQVHGYACHLCGKMYSTAEELMTRHVECDEWTRWKAREEKNKQGKLPMTFCRMMVCCADCGWHTTLSEDDERNEEEKMNYLSTFFANHNNEGLLSMLVYFPAHPTMDVDAIKFNVHLTVGGDPTATCRYCLTGTFKDPSAANEHCMKFHSRRAAECGIDGCNARVMTDYFLEQHQFQHVHENSFFADFLSNSARVFPPPTKLSYAPRNGWRDRANTVDFAFGGVIGTRKGAEMGINLVDSAEEDLREAKAIMINERKRNDKGYQNAIIPLESDMAREVRLRLNAYRDCEGISGLLEGITWLRDEDALKFQDWMEYWESEEGKKLGGPPKENLIVDVQSSFVRIPSMEVELQLTDRDVLSGFLLNDNIFYCNECDSILKGQEAFDHLMRDGEAPSECAKVESGEVETNPYVNINMIQLFSSSISPPSSSLPCPHCPRRACSITGLRVHIMTDHGVYVPFHKAHDEVVGRVTPLEEHLRQNGTKKRRMRRSGDKMKDGEARKQGNEDGRSVKKQVKQAMGRIVADVVENGNKEASESVAADIPMEEGAELAVLEDKGDTDDDLAMMTEDEVGEDPLMDDDVLPMEVENDEVREEVENEEEKEVEAEEIQPVVRHFAPDGDDELCVVGEVNPGFSAFQPTVANQREKKFACPKCSERFMTRVRLDDHLEKNHTRDAGDTTISEELGIPLATRLFICKNCCLAFPTPEMKAAHAKQHDNQSVDCESCSGFAFNKAVLVQHLQRVNNREVSYVCGDCMWSFENETNLHEHSNTNHGVQLFYFCKRCEIGSTNGVDMFHHYMKERCPGGPTIKVTKDAVKCIGVIPANQLHFQPISLDCHRVVLEMHPNKYVVPSLCYHRSMQVGTEPRITCADCRGTVTLATYAALHEAKTGKKYDMKVTRIRSVEPLTAIRFQFQRMLIEQQRKLNKQVATVGLAPPPNGYQSVGGARGGRPSRSVGTVSASAFARTPTSMMRAQPDTVRPALTLLTPQNTNEAGPSRDVRQSMPNLTRNPSTKNFLGGTRVYLGTTTMGRQNGGGGRGGMIMRGSTVLSQSPMGNQNSFGAALMRGNLTPTTSRGNGEPTRMMNWARQRGYSVAREVKDLAGIPAPSSATTGMRQDGGRDTGSARCRPMPRSNSASGRPSMEAGVNSSTSISTPPSPSPTQNSPSTDH